MSSRPQCFYLSVRTPLPLGVLAYASDPDSDAETSSGDDIHGEFGFGGLGDDLFLSVVVSVGVRGPQGWRCSWLL